MKLGETNRAVMVKQIGTGTRKGVMEFDTGSGNNECKKGRRQVWVWKKEEAKKWFLLC